MVKTKAYVKSKNGMGKKTRRKNTVMALTGPSTKRRGAGAEDVTRITRHVNMIIDPCNAELGPTAYRGTDGIVTRFRSNGNLGPSAGKTGFIYVYYPAYNTVYTAYVNGADLAVTNLVGGPGQSFLLASSDSQRAVAACTSLTYTGTELDRSGIIYSGVIPIACIQATKTIDQLVMLLQHEGRTGCDPMELKWSPSAVDEEYWTTGSVVPEAPGDRNCLVFIGLGFNAATTSPNHAIVNTLITEWRPEAGLGLSTPNPSSHDVSGGIEKVRSTLARLGNWWSLTTGKAYKALNSPVGKAITSTVMALM
jgi:hypothetical protein